MILDEIIQRLGTALDRPELQAKQLAHQLGVTTQTLRNWRDGDHFPNKNRWLKIAGVTKVSLEWIFQGDTKMRAQNPLEEQLLEMYRGMKEGERDSLMTIANTFYNKAHPGPGPGNPYSKAANDPEPEPIKAPIKKVAAAKVVKKRSKPR